MAKQLQLRRGTTAQHSTFTGAVGEITVDTDKKVVVVHDGSTAGGIPLAKQTTVDTKAPLASPALTGTPTVNGISFSGYSGFKNYIINGKKTVNQRGLTSTDNSYNQDRWYKAGNNWYQGIEGDNNLLSGKTYTLSWEGEATASYYVGTETSATINAQTFTPIDNGGSFTLTISAGENLWIKFASDVTGSTFNFVQLEEGSVATPFEQRPYGLELSLCQRYYEVFSNYIAIPMSNDNAGATYGVLPCVNKRVSPTLSITSNGVLSQGAVGKAISSIVLYNYSGSVCSIVIVSSGLTAGYASLWYNFNVALSAEL